MATDEEVAKVLEEIVKNPDDFFPTFSEEIAEKARRELIKAYRQKNKVEVRENDPNQSKTG